MGFRHELFAVEKWWRNINCTWLKSKGSSLLQPSSDRKGGGDILVNEGKGRLFRRTDGKYLIYVPLKLAEDSMFPFKLEATEEISNSTKVKISFKIGGQKLTVEKYSP